MRVRFIFWWLLAATLLVTWTMPGQQGLNPSPNPALNPQIRFVQVDPTPGQSCNSRAQYLSVNISSNANYAGDVYGCVNNAWSKIVAPPANVTTMTFYLSKSGSDSSDCSTSGTACLTLAHVMTLVPSNVPLPVNIHVGACGSPPCTYSEPINISGYAPGHEISVISDDSTIANNVFSGTTTCDPPDGGVGYSSNVCNIGGWLAINGLTVSSASGQGRAIFTSSQARLHLQSFVATCPSLNTSQLGCLEFAGSSTVTLVSPVTVNLTGATAVGVGIQDHEGSYVSFYGDTGSHALTVAGPNANTDTLTGIEVMRRAAFDVHVLGGGAQTSTISVTGVNQGVAVLGGLWQQINTGTANPQLTISHTSGTSGTGIYVEAGSFYANVGGVQLTNLSVGQQVDSAGYVTQKNCTYTNVTTHTSVTTPGAVGCF